MTTRNINSRTADSMNILYQASNEINKIMYPSWDVLRRKEPLLHTKIFSDGLTWHPELTFGLRAFIKGRGHLHKFPSRTCKDRRQSSYLLIRWVLQWMVSGHGYAEIFSTVEWSWSNRHYGDYFVRLLTKGIDGRAGTGTRRNIQWQVPDLQNAPGG